MRGTGFYNWMTRADSKDSLLEAMAASSLNDRPAITLRHLPVINFLDVDDDKYIDALLEEALPEDRTRFRRYLSSKALGLGIFAAVRISKAVKYNKC